MAGAPLLRLQQLPVSVSVTRALAPQQSPVITPQKNAVADAALWMDARGYEEDKGTPLPYTHLVSSDQMMLITSEPTRREYTDEELNKGVTRTLTHNPPPNPKPLTSP